MGTCIVPLEPLLENRIGIRGWFTIKPFYNHGSSSVLETILQNNDPNVGGLEIAIRFTKSDDFLRVINAGKDIGWTRACDLEFVNRTPHAPLSITSNSECHDKFKNLPGDFLEKFILKNMSFLPKTKSRRPYNRYIIKANSNIASRAKSGIGVYQ